MKKLILLLSMILSVNSFSQDRDEADKVIQQFLEQRKQMMEQIMKAFDDDEFFQDDFMDDKLFDSIRQQGFQGFPGFSSSGENVKVEEKVQEDGSISVIITPKNKNTKLDIKTTDSQIVIKSEMMKKVENESQQGRSAHYSRSSYSQSVQIPRGFSAQTPKKQGESIVISLVPQKGGNFKPNSKGRVPVQKGYDQDTI